MNRNDIQKIRADVRRDFCHQILVLFREGNDLVAYFDDATVIGNALHLDIDMHPEDREHPMPTVRFPATMQQEFTGLLLKAGFAVHVYQAPCIHDNDNTILP